MHVSTPLLIAIACFLFHWIAIAYLKLKYFFLVNLTISFSLASNDVHENPQANETLDDDDNSKEIMKFKIAHERSAMSGDETETSSNKQEQLEEEKDSAGGGFDVEPSFDKAAKVNLHLLPLYSI